MSKEPELTPEMIRELLRKGHAAAQKLHEELAVMTVRCTCGSGHCSLHMVLR